MRTSNLYEVLQVSSNASPQVIQAAYRTLARSFHPDANAAPDAARLMLELNAAYGVLSDPEKRAKYDAQRRQSTRRSHPDDLLSASALRNSSRLMSVRTQRGAHGAPPGTSTGDAQPWRVLGIIALVAFILTAAACGVYQLAGALDDESPPPQIRPAVYLDNARPAIPHSQAGASEDVLNVDI